MFNNQRISSIVQSRSLSLEIIFLGTSSGVPTKSRNVSAVAVEVGQSKSWFLVDCGEATQHQLQHCRLSLKNLRAIAITHVHGDHCYGLPGLLASAGMTERTDSLVIIAPEGIKPWLETTMEMTQMYLPYSLEFIATEKLAEQQFDDVKITITPLSHRVPSFAYGFTQSLSQRVLKSEALKLAGLPQGPLWGELQSGSDVEFNNKTFLASDYVQTLQHKNKVVICGDNDNPNLLKSMCIDADVLVHESTYTEDMADKASNVGHSYATQVAQFAEEVSVPHLILTHFSARYQSNKEGEGSVEQMRVEAKRVFSGNLFLARDFDHFRLNQQHKLTLLNEEKSRED